MSAKTSAALSALLACMIFGSGCGKNANEPVRNDDSSSAENEAYKVSDNNSASDDISEKKDDTNIGEPFLSEVLQGVNEELNDASEIVTEFMNGLLYHNYDVFMQYSGAQSFSTYDFLNGVYLSDWEIVNVVEYDGNETENDDKAYTFEIKMNVSDSDCERFKTGESVWLLDVINSDNSYFSSFRPESESADRILNGKNDDFSDAVKMCYAFTSELGWVCGDEEVIDLCDVDKLVEKEMLANNLIEFCGRFNMTDGAVTENYTYSVDWLNESTEKLLGISGLDFTLVPTYDDENNTIGLTASKYSCGYGILTDEHTDTESGLHNVVIDWYADTICLAKACTMQYVLADNPDGTLRLQSVEMLYSSGERMAFYLENIER